MPSTEYDILTSGEMSGDRLTDLLFTLPAELRNEIYLLAIPEAEPHLPMDQPCPQLKWLASSKELFADAAPMFYSTSCFYHDSTLYPSPGKRTLAQHLNHHVYGSYSDLDQGWVMVEAGKLVKELVLDLRMTYEIVQELPERLRWYLRDCSTRLPNLEKLYIFFGPEFMMTKIETVSIRNDFETLNRNWILPEEYAGGTDFEAAITVVEELAPQGCNVKWRVAGQFNVLDFGKRVRPTAVYRDCLVRF